MQDPETTTIMLLWIISGAVLGALVTPLAFRQRGYAPLVGLLLGALLGAGAHLLALLPLWLLLPARPGSPGWRAADPAELENRFTIQMQSMTLAGAALAFPDNNLRYVVVDAASGSPVLSATEFQLEYLKTRMAAPGRHEEGWYFLRQFLPLVDGDAASLHDDSAARHALLHSAQATSGNTTLPVNQLEREALVLKRKGYELEQLHAALLRALAEDDAFEVDWRAYTSEQDARGSDTLPVNS